MTRADLFDQLAQKRRLANSQAELIVAAIFDGMAAAFRREERVDIRGFGTFTVRRYQGYQGRNPKTGEAISVKAKRLPHFKPSKTFSARLNPPDNGKLGQSRAWACAVRALSSTLI